MAKKKENIQDILDRINEDIETIREKVEELESQAEDSEFEDEDDGIGGEEKFFIALIENANCVNSSKHDGLLEGIGSSIASNNSANSKLFSKIVVILFAIDF